jgi:hypothetical protein
MKSMKKEGLLVIEKFYRFLIETNERIIKFPRIHKFTLGDRMINNLYQILETFIIFKYSKNKTGYLMEINNKIEIARFHLRLSHDLKIINTKSYEYLSEKLDEIGSMTGGLLKKEMERI